MNIPDRFGDRHLQRFVHAGVFNVIRELRQVRRQICGMCVGPIFTKSEQCEKDLMDVVPRLSAARRDELPVELLKCGDQGMHACIGDLEKADEAADRDALAFGERKAQGKWMPALLTYDTTNALGVLVNI